MNSPEAKPRPVRSYLLPAAALYVAVQSFSLLAPILLSLLLIILMTLALNPVVARLRATTGRRAVAAGVVVAAFVTVLLLTGFAFFKPMKASVGKLSERLPTYWERVQKPLIKMEKQAGLSEEKLQAEVTTEVMREKAASGDNPSPERTDEPPASKSTDHRSFIRSGLGQLLQTIAERVTSAASNVTQLLVVLVTVFFGVTFTLMNPRPVFGSLLSVVPEPHHAQVVTILQRIGTFMPGWALATLIAMVLVGSLVFLLTWPLLGFADALVLGMIAGVLEAIPYLGPILSAVPGLVLALGAGGATPIWILAIYVGVEFVENNLIEPLVMAGRLDLHPLAVMISMLLCGSVFGVLGMIIAAPVVGIVDILHDELYRKRFLPTVTGADLDRMARSVLRETK